MSTAAQRPVREFIPEARISCSRIRALVAHKSALGCWSCGSPEAIRPMRLAILLRRYIWTGHDIPLAAIAKRLRQASEDGIPFEIVIDIDIGQPEPQRVVSLTRFRRRRSGRIVAQIEMQLGETRAAITTPILLTAPAEPG